MDILEVEGNFLDFLILSRRLGTDVMYDVTKTIEADQELFEQHYDGQCEWWLLPQSHDPS